MSFQFKPDSLTTMDERLRIRKNLQEITNRIHAAQNIAHILVEIKDGILNLFNASSITIYVVDKHRDEIYSMFLAGTQIKEIRVPISNQSIAGYVANTYNIVNIGDAYNQAELKAIDFELTFDSSWDKKSGFRTKQILAAPIFYEDQLMGVIQILNKKFGDGKFSEEEVGLAMEIAEVLGVAFYNQQRFARRRKTRFDFLITRGLIKEEDLEAAWEEAREQKEPIEKYLMRKYRI
jgi:GAF domain-containing protein